MAMGYVQYGIIQQSIIMIKVIIIIKYYYFLFRQWYTLFSKAGTIIIREKIMDQVHLDRHI